MPSSSLLTALAGDNGYPHARAAWGMYCNVGSALNRAGVLHEGPMTSQRAELYGGIHAAGTAYEILLGIPAMRVKPRLVVIKTDSSYLVNGMVDWVRKWRINGYKTARKQPVVNGDLFRRLDRLLHCSKREGMDIRFWQVPRELNAHADKLANAALDDVHPAKFANVDYFDGLQKSLFEL